LNSEARQINRDPGRQTMIDGLRESIPLRARCDQARGNSDNASAGWQ
jgi:hypothetical protein